MEENNTPPVEMKTEELIVQNGDRQEYRENDSVCSSVEEWSSWETSSFCCDQNHLLTEPESELELPLNKELEDFELKPQYFDRDKQEEMDWKEQTGLNDDTLKGAVETVIFMSERPISLVKIRDMIDKIIPLKFIHLALSELQQEYEKSYHGIRLLEVAEGYQFRTKATYSRFVQGMFKLNSLVLTPSALEVLAIIAYKQPVSRADIDRIRGVDSSHIVRTLMDKKLVKMMGRSDDLGRPTLYGTTLEFLEVFNLADISELPSEYELEEMASKEKASSVNSIKDIVGETKKERFFYDELAELDELSRNIRSIETNTPFTKTLNVEEKKRVDESGIVVKSAFDILEEFVIQKEIKEQNVAANLSEMLISACSPVVVDDLLKLDLNAPCILEDEEFQMIDLDTGEVISDHSLTSDDGEDCDDSEDEDMFTEEEKADLDSKLDEVFDRLASGKGLDTFTQDDEEDFLGSDYDGLGEKEQDLDGITEQIIEKAFDYDLDLAFLQDDVVNNSFSEDDSDRSFDM